MLFNSFQFAFFLLLLLIAYQRTAPGRRNRVLLVASLVFYSMWVPQYLLLLLADLGVNYLLLRGMVRSPRPGKYLLAACVLSLGVLGYYKYAGFFAAQVNGLLGRFAFATLPVPEIFLPLGISFFTFQMMALTIDIYRGELEPVESFREYVLFIMFFPQLIAGPILRGRQFLPQLRRGGVQTAERTHRGVWLVIGGLVKKVILADALLAPYANRVFGSPGFASAPEHLIAIYSFAFQIYFDFSGYTDIARGIGLLLGFELPLNFKEPYLSRNPVEFWRRWHITLSTWLRDYLYIPLGGNRAGRGRTYVNLMLTMLLGGLWHGAGWNFVIWGGLHGLLLAVHRRFRQTTAAIDERVRWRDVPSIILLFHAVCFLWIFFRAATFGDAVAIIQKLAGGDYTRVWPVFQMGVVLLCAVLHCLERPVRLNLSKILTVFEGVWGAAAEGVLAGAIAGLVVLLGGAGGEFIYFQF